ncbi:MAG: hypothetical protein ACRD8W_06055 [Nitrososphaeraceae archaeon]
MEAYKISIPVLSQNNFSNYANILPVSYAHLDHLPHYNSGGNRYSWGNYSSYMALEPEYGVVKERPTAIEFSIQDRNNNDVHNVTTQVEIYETITGERVRVFPWTFREIGDFVLYYVFPRTGSHQIVLSILDVGSKDVNEQGDNYLADQDIIGTVDPPRTFLSATTSCDCERTIFNITINPTYGIVQNIMFAVIVIFPLAILGAILLWKYRSHRKRLSSGNDFRTTPTRREYIRYMVMLLAIAGGILHLAVFPDHATLHIYYSLFLLAAAASQVAYGILFVLITLSDDRIVQPLHKESINQQNERRYRKQQVAYNYRKNMIINLFGLFGTSVLIGLYVYSVVFPPPLSPTDTAEEVEIEGIVSKLLELFLVIGITFIIKWDRKKAKMDLVRLSSM